MDTFAARSMEMRAALAPLDAAERRSAIYKAVGSRTEDPWNGDELIALVLLTHLTYDVTPALLINRPLSSMAQGVSSVRIIKDGTGLALLLDGIRDDLYHPTAWGLCSGGRWVTPNGWIPSAYVRQQPPPSDYMEILALVRERNVRALNKRLMEAGK